MFVFLTNTEEECGGGKNGRVDLLLQGVLAVFVTEILMFTFIELTCIFR